MIRIFTCGGTIDKVYFDASSAYQVGVPHITAVLAQLKFTTPFTVTELMRKDSLDMSDEDRLHIRDAVTKASEDRILITHGTDTLVETAQFIGPIPGKRVVCTGAMLPGSMQNSDAVFNIAFALGVLMNPLKDDQGFLALAIGGGVFDPFAAYKNKELGRFELRE